LAVPPPLQAAILDWYDARGRSLPFRGTTDPYLVLVSEVMAQQTQIARVGEAWRVFTTTFPTFERLADASPADVLRAWRGLGYNRRALNLWRAARVVIDEHGGRLPSDVAALERLPGIGPYTARAVAAIAFGAPVGAVDTNVRRVLGRTMAGATDTLSAAELQSLADASVPADRAADWTHALMDVGATFCRSTRPACEACPARPWCRYSAEAAPRAMAESGRGPSLARDRAAPFSSTSRWLRGRILDREHCAAVGTRVDESLVPPLARSLDAHTLDDGPLAFFGRDQLVAESTLHRRCRSLSPFGRIDDGVERVPKPNCQIGSCAGQPPPLVAENRPARLGGYASVVGARNKGGPGGPNKCPRSGPTPIQAWPQFEPNARAERLNLAPGWLYAAAAFAAVSAPGGPAGGPGDNRPAQFERCAARGPDRSLSLRGPRPFR